GAGACWLAEQVAHPGAAEMLTCLERLAVRVSALVDAEFHGLPDRKLAPRRLDDRHFAAQQALHACLAAELLDDCVELTGGEIGRCEVHCVLLGLTRPPECPLIRGGI